MNSPRPSINNPIRAGEGLRPSPCTPSQIYFLIYPIPCPSQGVHFTFTNLDWNNLQLADAANWGLPNTRIFRVPYNFYSKTKAKGHFYITASRPPLQNMGGIIGLTVDETSKTSSKRLIMRVLAGRMAPR